MRKAKKNIRARNKCARIINRIDNTGKMRTETVNRDAESLTIAISTDPRSHASRLFIDDVDGTTVEFTGATARTLFRTLWKHYWYTDKSLV